MRRALRFVVALGLGGCGSVAVSNLNPNDFVGLSAAIDCETVPAGFSADVVPLFASRGCAEGGCHAGPSPAGGLDLDAASSGAAALHANCVAEERITVSSPPASKLLRKPLGLDGHGGGQIYPDASDPGYVTTYCWISSGAAAD